VPTSGGAPSGEGGGSSAESGATGEGGTAGEGARRRRRPRRRRGGREGREGAEGAAPRPAEGQDGQPREAGEAASEGAPREAREPREPRRDGREPRREGRDPRRDGREPRRDGREPRREGRDPRREGRERREPREGAPREGAPREGAPREGAPREGAPREGAPREGRDPRARDGRDGRDRGRPGEREREPRDRGRGDERGRRPRPRPATDTPAPPRDLVQQGGLAFPDEGDWELDGATPPPALAARAPDGDDDDDERYAGEALRATGPSLLEVPEPELDPDRDDEHADLDPGAPEGRGTVCNVAQVYLRDRCWLCPLEAGELSLAVGDRVVVETDQGLSIGVVAKPPTRSRPDEPPRRILRRVDANDLRQQTRNVGREREAYIYCRERIKQRGLPMKLIRVEYLHGGNKAIFYFAAENRVDFRELVKDLAGRLHTRIVMRQVGVRDEAKMTGGIGSCGGELCCATWLPKFEPVSIRMAKDQNLVLNPQKVSGQCGRLKCCLGYEQGQYHECRKGMPKPGRRVRTPDGDGKVIDVDILRQQVRVYRDDGTEQLYTSDQLQPAPPPGRDGPEG